MKTFDKIKDWAIFARAKDIMAGNDLISENDAIEEAITQEGFDFKDAMDTIYGGVWDAIKGVTVHDDDTFDIEDDFYTDAHMGEIATALAESLREAREDTEAYEAEVSYNWYHR